MVKLPLKIPQTTNHLDSSGHLSRATEVSGHRNHPASPSRKSSAFAGANFQGCSHLWALAILGEHQGECDLWRLRDSLVTWSQRRCSKSGHQDEPASQVSQDQRCRSLCHPMSKPFEFLESLEVLEDGDDLHRAQVARGPWQGHAQGRAVLFGPAEALLLPGESQEPDIT